MTLIELNERSGRQSKTHFQFEQLIDELKKRELPNEMVELINSEIVQVNAATGSEKEFARQLVKSKARVIKELEKQLKIVPTNYYKNLWMTTGMAAFGLPLGVVIGASIGNMAYLGIGLPIGIAIGAVLGASMDKKAKKEGRQLDLKIT